VFRPSQFCARSCYVAGGGVVSVAVLVSGWAVSLPAT